MNTNRDAHFNSLLADASYALKEGARPDATSKNMPLRGRFALLPVRDEIITAEHVRELMEREGMWAHSPQSGARGALCSM